MLSEITRPRTPQELRKLKVKFKFSSEKLHLGAQELPPGVWGASRIAELCNCALAGENAVVLLSRDTGSFTNITADQLFWAVKLEWNLVNLNHNPFSVVESYADYFLTDKYAKENRYALMHRMRQRGSPIWWLQRIERMAIR